MFTLDSKIECHFEIENVYNVIIDRLQKQVSTTLLDAWWETDPQELLKEMIWNKGRDCEIKDEDLIHHIDDWTPLVCQN